MIILREIDYQFKLHKKSRISFSINHFLKIVSKNSNFSNENKLVFEYTRSTIWFFQSIKNIKGQLDSIMILKFQEFGCKFKIVYQQIIMGGGGMKNENCFLSQPKMSWDFAVVLD